MIAEDWHPRNVYARQLGYRARRNRLNSHPPIGVGRVVLHSRQRGDILLAWREMAERVARASPLRVAAKCPRRCRLPR